MTATVEAMVNGIFTTEHNSLSASLDAAAKVHMLLPEGLLISGWQVLPGQASGQLRTHPRADASVIAVLVALSRQPGWSLLYDAPVYSRMTETTYIEIAAVTEIDGVRVRIWDHVYSDVDLRTFDGGVPA